MPASKFFRQPIVDAYFTLELAASGHRVGGIIFDRRGGRLPVLEGVENENTVVERRA
jgi:hypothetical protein